MDTFMAKVRREDQRHAFDRQMAERSADILNSLVKNNPKQAQPIGEYRIENGRYLPITDKPQDAHG